MIQNQAVTSGTLLSMRPVTPPLEFIIFITARTVVIGRCDSAEKPLARR
jgi:hypothetical protein